MTAIWNPDLGYFTVDIMIDIDDVVVPWFDTVDAECRAAFDPDGLLGPCTVWSMWEHYKVPQRAWEECVIEAVRTGLYHSVEPIPGAVEGLNRLHWYGHRLHFVTARGFMKNADNIRAWTPAYLENFGIAHDTLTFAKDKVRAQLELGLRFDYAIDDGGHNFTALTEDGIDTYLCDAPHNQTIDTPKRVAGLWEFANTVLRETTPVASQKPAFAV